MLRVDIEDWIRSLSYFKEYEITDCDVWPGYIHITLCRVNEDVFKKYSMNELKELLISLVQDLDIWQVELFQIRNIRNTKYRIIKLKFNSFLKTLRKRLSKINKNMPNFFKTITYSPHITIRKYGKTFEEKELKMVEGYPLTISHLEFVTDGTEQIPYKGHTYEIRKRVISISKNGFIHMNDHI